MERTKILANPFPLPKNYNQSDICENEQCIMPQSSYKDLVDVSSNNIRVTMVKEFIGPLTFTVRFRLSTIQELEMIFQHSQSMNS